VITEPSGPSEFAIADINCQQASARLFTSGSTVVTDLGEMAALTTTPKKR
jgi:hypothetical protein